MLGRQSPQGELFRPDHIYLDHVGTDSFYGFLGSEGRRLFKDEDFSGMYQQGWGRPSVPPSQLAVALLLQHHDGVSDEEAIQRSAYDLRWKVALGIELDEKLCAKSTLQLFRAKLVLHEQYGRLFEKSVEACRKAGLLKRRKLEVAIDTTPVLGRGAVKDTFNLVSDQIRRVVERACDLKGWDRDDVTAEHGLGKHFAKSFKGSVELDWSDPQARRALVGQLVGDAKVALELATKALRGYARDSEKTQELREARDLLADLLQQDIEEEPEDGQGPRIRQGTRRDRVVSTTDPEMRHGHKSHSKGFEGYKASVVAESRSGVILATDARAANVHDGQGASDLVKEADRQSEGKVERVLGDTAYGSIETRREFEDLDLEVVAKAPPVPRRQGCFTVEDFKIDTQRGVAKCPAGKRSIRRDRARGPYPGWKYVFSRKDCGSCPLRHACTTSRISARMVTVTEATEALRKLRRKQKTKTFQRTYRRRATVEHRIGRLRHLGIGQARYLGKAKVAFQVALAATVANLTLAASSGLFLLLASMIIVRNRFPATLRLKKTCRRHGNELFKKISIKLPGYGIGSEMTPSRPGF